MPLNVAGRQLSNGAIVVADPATGHAAARGATT